MAALRILIADDESIRLMSLRAQLMALGHVVVAEACNGQEAITLAAHTQPDLAILDIKMPLVDGIEAAERITQARPIPIILLTAYSETQLVERAAQADISAYLMKPISEEDLLPAITLALTRFREFQASQQEVANLREALEARKKIEQAKGILMRRLGLGEAEAYRRLQRQSQETNRKLAQVAEALITADQLL
ncbi:MAG: response regulator [Anaerolineae bacterium CG2_30_64_16]|nr:MAG: response regulator [Anaerolineae bacterium CG2_30_64_16]